MIIKISLGTLLIAQMFNYTALQPSFKLEISNGTTREFTVIAFLLILLLLLLLRYFRRKWYF